MPQLKLRLVAGGSVWLFVKGWQISLSHMLVTSLLSVTHISLCNRCLTVKNRPEGASFSLNELDYNITCQLWAGDEVVSASDKQVNKNIVKSNTYINYIFLWTISVRALFDWTDYWLKCSRLTLNINMHHACFWLIDFLAKDVSCISDTTTMSLQKMLERH